MRDDRLAAPSRRVSWLVPALAGLGVWLVVQNASLVLMVAWPVVPAALTVARALAKAALALAAPLAPAALVVVGACMLWAASVRAPSPGARRLGETNHG